MGKHSKKFTRNYKSKYDVGTVHTCSQGEFIILERIKATEENGLKSARAVIRFTATGYTCNVQLSNIPQNKIKDRRLPTVYGVGYLDMDITIPARGSGSIIRATYDLWANMLKRVYGKYDVYYDNITVDKRWHSFKQFLNTIHNVKGYDKWLKDSSMHLDKDRSGSTVYSMTTCEFLSGSNNSTLAAQKRWHGVNGPDVNIKD